ncbi:hypothetical protein QUF58_08060 [Anaerolineales bacterium HSG24]|nr:hypothetical protein [Anaerolineales bacterium HSG24]
MAKRKSKGTGASKIKMPTNYHDEEFVPYIICAETGVLKLDTTNPLTDGQVRDALKILIKSLKQTDNFYAVLTSMTSLQESSKTIEATLILMILEGLEEAFDDYGALSTTDTIGILKTVNQSIGKVTGGLEGRGYLTFMRGFMSKVGIETRPLTVAEQKAAE